MNAEMISMMNVTYSIAQPSTKTCISSSVARGDAKPIVHHIPTPRSEL